MIRICTPAEQPGAINLTALWKDAIVPGEKGVINSLIIIAKTGWWDAS